MALITLTPDQSVNALYPASISIDEADLYRATSFVDASYPLANASVVFSAPSAFLGDQQTIVVKETVATIDSLSSLMVTVTVGSASVLINAANVIDVITDGGTGSKVLYKEFGNVTTIFTTQAPSVIKSLVGVALNSAKTGVIGNTYTANPSTALASEVIAGILVCNAVGAMTLNFDSIANFSASGLKVGGSISFFVNNTGGGAATMAPGAGGAANASNDAGFGGAGKAMEVASGSIAKFEIYGNSGSTYVLSRVY